MRREKTCAKHVKLAQQDRDRMTDKQLSHRPRKCLGAGGSSGKSDNAGAAPRFEQGGHYGNPGRSRPGHVSARSL